MAVFQIITMDSWSLIMYNLVDGSGKLSFMPILFSVTLIIFGSYFLLNLVLAVIMSDIVKLLESEQENLRQEYERMQALIEFYNTNFSRDLQIRRPEARRLGMIGDQ